MSEYIVKGAEPKETVLHTRTPNGYEEWQWLPVREQIVRCKDCVSYERDHDPIDPGWPMRCADCGRDMLDPDGFCAWGERREDE